MYIGRRDYTNVVDEQTHWIFPNTATSGYAVKYFNDQLKSFIPPKSFSELGENMMVVNCEPIIIINKTTMKSSK